MLMAKKNANPRSSRDLSADDDPGVSRNQRLAIGIGDCAQRDNNRQRLRPGSMGAERPLRELSFAFRVVATMTIGKGRAQDPWAWWPLRELSFAIRVQVAAKARIGAACLRAWARTVDDDAAAAACLWGRDRRVLGS